MPRRWRGGAMVGVAGVATVAATALTVAAPTARGEPAVAAVGALASAVPEATVETLASDLAIPWDVAPTPDGGLLLTERGGPTHFRDAAGSLRTVVTDQSDLFVGSESGLMGITTDPGFASNRTYYTCQAYRGAGTTPIDIRVVRWHLADDSASAVRRGTVVTGLPITSGRHGGCRLRFAPDRTLHIGTGDAATGTNPQDLDSLGGKTLRVDARDGSAPADNPFAAAGGNRALVWTYGHRNVQGLAVRPGTTQVWSAEHGPDRDDEVNLLVRGGNYGWNPVPGYNESVPMTDLITYPSAVPARWSSGFPTVATSGIGFLTGSRWGRWEGALAVAELKNQGVRVLSLTPDGRVRGDEQFPLLDNVYGRVRTVQPALADNTIYVTTSNGSADRLLRVTATAAQPAYRAGLDVSPSGVAVVNRSGLLTAYYRATDGRVRWTSQTTAGGTWTAARAIAGTIASAPAAVSWGGARVDLFARGANGHLLHAWSNGGASYSSWQDLGGSITTAPAVTSLSTGTLDVVARGAGDALLRRRWDGRSWSPFTSLGGVLAAAPAATADPVAGRVTVFARTGDGSLSTIVLTPTGVARGWSRVGARETWSAPAVSSRSSAAVVTRTVGGVRVLTTFGPPVVVTRNADLTPVVSLRGFTTAVGGTVTGAMAVAQRSPTSYAVLGRGTDNALWVFDGRPGHYSWSRIGGTLS